MKIVWDPLKRIKNIEKHGLDFADLGIDFFSAAVVVPARQGRLKAIGLMPDNVIAVIFVTLGREGISLISLRPASRHERRLYDQRQSPPSSHH